MRKITIFTVCILLVMSCLLIYPMKTVQASEILYVGGSNPGNYTTIQSAINDANPKDTIFVYDGVYLETVDIDKAITLKGENRANTIIDGMYQNNVINMTSDNISFSGFTIKNSGGFQNNAAITIHSNTITISDCIIYRSRIGIRISNSAFTTIRNCICRNICVLSLQF